MTTPKSITFFYPSKIIGGAEYLFIRMANFIANETTIPVYVIDFKEGFLRQQLKETKVTVVDYSDAQQLIINYDTTIVTSFNHIFNIKNFKTSNEVNILFWSIHPTHFTSYFKNRSWFITASDKQEITNSFKKIIDHHSMVFMDYPNYYENASFLNFSLQVPPYLPIPCDVYDGSLKSSKTHKSINICWLGRIAVDKVNSIINIAQHISQLPKEIKSRINFIVIGNGEEDEKLIRELDKLKVKYEKKGTIINDQLNDFLITNVDIGFAMGTSTLEFAKLKIPVVLVDVFDGDIPKDNNFQWLFSTKGYSLGEYYSPTNLRTLTISDIVRTCDNAETYAEKGAMCYDYYVNHHEIKSIANSLLNYLSKDLIRIDDQELKKINKIMNPLFFRLMKDLKNRLNPKH